ncbi:hypothetical protein N1F89_10765, partial [Aquibium sp. A9E412]|uniref:hypothetical protein n=1 Tax=Aquibium sp. A9E412 TaxID=2976767 RepID=UPI0025B1A00F
ASARRGMRAAGAMPAPAVARRTAAFDRPHDPPLPAERLCSGAFSRRSGMDLRRRCDMSTLGVAFSACMAGAECDL